MSKSKTTPVITSDEALLLLEESLSYFTPIPVRKATAQDYESFPLAS